MTEIDLDHRQLVGMVIDLHEAMKEVERFELINQTFDRQFEYAGRLTNLKDRLRKPVTSVDKGFGRFLKRAAS